MRGGGDRRERGGSFGLAHDTTASLYFANSFPKKMSFLTSTHPPIDDRIKRLRSVNGPIMVVVRFK